MRLLALASTTLFAVISLLYVAVEIKFYIDAYRYFGRFSIYELAHDVDLRFLLVAILASLSFGFLYRRLARSQARNAN